MAGEKRDFSGEAASWEENPMRVKITSDMIMEPEREIEALEQSLYEAMMKSDVAALDALLADDLIFTDHTGKALGKEADIGAHRSGAVAMEKIEWSERAIKTFGDAAAVSVLLAITGKFSNRPFRQGFRYTRVWAKRNGAWKVVAAHSSVVTQ